MAGADFVCCAARKGGCAASSSSNTDCATAPLRTGRAAFPHPAPRWRSRAHGQLVVDAAGDIVIPALRPDDACVVDVASVAPFPPPELPGFTGTMARSDFSDAICLSRLFASAGIPGPTLPSVSGTSEISKVAIPSDCQTRADRRPRVPMKIWPLATFMMLPSVIATTSARSSRNTLSGLHLIHGRAATPVHSTSSAFSPRLLRRRHRRHRWV